MMFGCIQGSGEAYFVARDAEGRIGFFPRGKLPWGFDPREVSDFADGFAILNEEKPGFGDIARKDLQRACGEWRTAFAALCLALLERAGATCPFSAGDILDLAESYKRMRKAVVMRVCVPFMSGFRRLDPMGLSSSTGTWNSKQEPFSLHPWAVQARLLRKDNSQSEWVIIGKRMIAGKSGEMPKDSVEMDS